jgi:hypothetical protein
MSEASIVRVHVITVWLFLVASIVVFVVHGAVMLVPGWRRHFRPRVVCHIAVLASLYLIAVYGVMVQKPNFQKLYRYFHAQRPNQAMQLTASKPDVYALSACRRERRLWIMHRGLAAADLVSR